MTLGKNVKEDQFKTVLTTTILRKWNQQWRVMSHHASRISYSEFTGNAKKFLPIKVRTSPAKSILYGPS